MNTASENQAATNQDHVLPHLVIRCGIFPGRFLEAATEVQNKAQQTTPI